MIAGYTIDLSFNRLYILLLLSVIEIIMRLEGIVAYLSIPKDTFNLLNLSIEFY